nr:hypothetical protein [uncultured Draconibacterium sp.]
MRVYLDNNILVSIEDKQIELNFSKNKFSDKIEYVYSYAHISELLEANDISGQLTAKRINTISSVTNNCYCYPYGNVIEFKIEEPQFVIDTLKLHNGFFSNLRNSVKTFNPDREKLITALKIDKKRINNYSTTEVIEQLNSLLKSETPVDFVEMVHLAGTSLHGKIYAVFNFLDFLGYWSDKKNAKSNVARYNDASHVFFASSCDCFVSNDLRARNKAKVAYELFDLKTEIYSFDEFKKKKISA